MPVRIKGFSEIVTTLDAHPDYPIHGGTTGGYFAELMSPRGQSFGPRFTIPSSELE